LKVIGMIQEIYEDTDYSRAVDLGDEVLQILASTLETKTGKSRKDSPCYRWVYLIRAGSSQLEFNGKAVETGQCGQTRTIASGEI
jgi:hypothetical protein